MMTNTDDYRYEVFIKVWDEDVEDMDILTYGFETEWEREDFLQGAIEAMGYPVHYAYSEIDWMDEDGTKILCIPSDSGMPCPTCGGERDEI